MWPHAEQFNDYIPLRGMRVSIPVPLPLPISTPTHDPPGVYEPLSFPSHMWGELVALSPPVSISPGEETCKGAMGAATQLGGVKWLQMTAERG